MDRQIGCSHILAILSNAAMNLGVQIPFQIVISLPCEIHAQIEMLDHMTVLFFMFWRTIILCSILATPSYIRNSAQGFPFLHIRTNISIFILLTTAVPTAVWWYLTVVLVYTSPMISMLSTFSCTCGHLNIYFRKMSTQVLCPVFNWIGAFICFVIELYEFFIFWVLIPYQRSDLQIFFPIP